MRSLRCFLICSIVALLAPTARAQNEAAEAKAAAKGFYGAVAKGDAAEIQEFLRVENDPQQQLSKTYADLILAGKKLGEAAKEKFPGAVGAFAQGTIAPEDVHLIDTSEARVQGDWVTLKLSGRPEPIELRRIEGEWKVFIRQEDNSPQRIETQRALLAGWINVMNQTAKEISENQFPTIQEAESTVKERLGAVLAKALQGSPPTSRPASRPS